MTKTANIYGVLFWMAALTAASSVLADGGADKAVDTGAARTGIDSATVNKAESARLKPADSPIDEKSASPEPAPLPADTEVPPLALPSPSVSHTGASLSAFLPGSGQIYQRRYVMGGLFFVAEASVIGYAVYWREEAGWWRSEVARLKDSSSVVYGRGESAADSAAARAYFYDAGKYLAIADRADFEARDALNTAYGALAIALGIHLYNFLDALEAGGVTAHGAEKDPTKAGLLAAVPFLGLGQAYNERPSKAGMMILAQTSLALTAYNNHRQMSYASDKYNQMRDSTSARYQYRAEYLSFWKGRYDNAFSRRNTYLWISLAAYLYSIFDAVVDAHLSDYDEKIKVGTDLAVGTGKGGVGYGVLTLTYRF